MIFLVVSHFVLSYPVLLCGLRDETEIFVRSCPAKKGIPKNAVNFTGKHLCRRLFATL